MPIGALSHSFGLETLAAEGGLDAPQLSHFFSEWLQGNGHMEAVFCVLAPSVRDEDAWQRLNETASAMRPAREIRDASLRLGRRLLGLAATLEPHARLRYRGEAHLCTAFGLIGAVLGCSAAETVGAFLHQALFGATSACQRIMPLGQTAAMQMLWHMKPQIAKIIQAACAKPEADTLWGLQPGLEIASMRHPMLHTRLFIS